MAKRTPKIIEEIEKIEEAEERGFKKIIKNPSFRVLVVFFILVVVASLIIYLNISHSRVYIERSSVSAPVISLVPSAPGILERVFVREGDIVSDGMVVAQVGGVPIKAQTAGVVTSIQNTPGQFVTSQTPVVQMIDPSELRVVGLLEEDKGLKDVHVGQKVVFTVDAFGSKIYYGTVDSVSPTSHQSDIVFSISTNRAEQDFDVTVRYDINDYPELKNGMSAKMWVYK